MVLSHSFHFKAQRIYRTEFLLDHYWQGNASPGAVNWARLGCMDKLSGSLSSLSVQDHQQQPKLQPGDDPLTAALAAPQPPAWAWCHNTFGRRRHGQQPGSTRSGQEPHQLDHLCVALIHCPWLCSCAQGLLLCPAPEAPVHPARRREVLLLGGLCELARCFRLASPIPCEPLRKESCTRRRREQLKHLLAIQAAITGPRTRLALVGSRCSEETC